MGGGVMRTAAKAAAIGAFRTSFFGETSRKAARHQTSSYVPAVEHGIGAPMIHAGNTRSETPSAAVATYCSEWELEEWELTGGESQICEPVNVASRLIFGPVPTFEEAKEATTDLKEAMEKVYFAPQHVRDSHEGCQETASGENTAISNVSVGVAKMFSLLQESPEAQMVVASLASDKNVWDAVMKNEKVLQFCQTTLTESASESMLNTDESDWNIPLAAESQKESSEGSSLMNFLNTIKYKVAQFVGNISEFIQDMLGKLVDTKYTDSDADSNHANTSVKSVFLALAISVIVLVLLKRV